jgi:hypothetical protein
MNEGDEGGHEEGAKMTFIRKGERLMARKKVVEKLTFFVSRLRPREQ